MAKWKEVMDEVTKQAPTTAERGSGAVLKLDSVLSIKGDCKYFERCRDSLCKLPLHMGRKRPCKGEGRDMGVWPEVQRGERRRVFVWVPMDAETWLDKE